MTAVPDLRVGQGPRTISDRGFRRYQRWIHAETGIHLTDAKRALLVGRLWRRVRDLGFDSYEAYLEHVESGDPPERVRLINAICTHETQFFREPRQFEYLADQLIPRWLTAARNGTRSRTLRVWSAACSSGEEPYSVAMTLLDRLPPGEGWHTEIIATDISTQVLERARAGIFPLSRAQNVPGEYKRRFLLKGRGEQEGRCAVGPELRDAVTFQHFNLSAAEWPAMGRFDLILCRNVLIYFDQAGRQQVIERLRARLAPEGHLFLGHAESLNGIPTDLKTMIPTVYSAVGADA
ncbi:MAG: CheR family methyltransferase [Gemmatimonadales bacterium]